MMKNKYSLNMTLLRALAKIAVKSGKTAFEAGAQEVSEALVMMRVSACISCYCFWGMQGLGGACVVITFISIFNMVTDN